MPSRISARTSRPAFISSARSTEAGARELAGDDLLVERLAEPALLAADEDENLALALQAKVGHLGRSSGTRPTPPIAGVGGMPTPFVSL